MYLKYAIVQYIYIYDLIVKMIAMVKCYAIFKLLNLNIPMEFFD